jgi:nucleoside-diphosphate-sugar epimerase
MRVFITGATGFIGSAVVRDLLEAGHEVVGLARSDTAAAPDGVIHLAFIHDFSDYAGASLIDLRAVEAMGAALEGSCKPFVVTSGTLVLTRGRLGTEDDAPDPGAPAATRIASEHATIALAERGVRASVVRLAPCVHDTSRQGFATLLAGVAREKGVSAFVGDGSNRWPAVHRLDAARLYGLALEAAPAGSRLHGVGEEGVRFREIAEAIGRKLAVPVVSIAPEDAAGHFGWMAAMVSIDNPTSSALTRGRLGWAPEGPGLVADIEDGGG